MNDEVKKPETPDAGNSEEKKEAEGQKIYNLYCSKCGHTWASSRWDNYCPRWGCYGEAKLR